MKINKYKLLLVFMLMGSLLLAACGKDKDTEKKQGTNTESRSDTQANQNNQDKQKDNQEEATTDEAAPPIKEAKNIPAQEKKALLAVLNQHVKTFNKKDLDGYMDTISKNPKSFKYDEEREYMKKVFETMDLKIEPQTALIIDYKSTEANIFTEMKTIAAEAGSKKKIEKVSRQVNTFRKEVGKWKLIATFAMETK